MVKNNHGITLRLFMLLTLKITYILVLGHASIQADEPSPNNKFLYFRAPENDGINCLYLQLRSLGYKESYLVFRQRSASIQQPYSLQTLATIARQEGFFMRPVKINFEDLSKEESPLILYFEEGEIGRGHFRLFVAVADDKQHVGVVNGAFVTREWMSRDDFRRHWTGYALKPESHNPLWLTSSRILALASLGAIILLLSRKLSNKYKRNNMLFNENISRITLKSIY